MERLKSTLCLLLCLTILLGILSGCTGDADVSQEVHQETVSESTEEVIINDVEILKAVELGFISDDLQNDLDV